MQERELCCVQNYLNSDNGRAKYFNQINRSKSSYFIKPCKLAMKLKKAKSEENFSKLVDRSLGRLIGVIELKTLSFNSSRIKLITDSATIKNTIKIIY